MPSEHVGRWWLEVKITSRSLFRHHTSRRVRGQGVWLRERMSFRTVKAFRLKELSAFTSKLKDSASSASETPIQLLNPFIPHKNTLTGRWAPPKYSLRQQADLVKSAKASNLIHLLPYRPKSAASTDGLLVTPLKPVPTEWWRADVVWKDSKPPIENKEERKDSLEEDEPPRKVAPRIEVKQMEGLGALRMYAGRKRMFKGHKWERVQGRRQKRTQILMRDMNKRITRYKEVRAVLLDFIPIEIHRTSLQWYHRRKPNPLMPPRGAKAPKLPF